MSLFAEGDERAIRHALGDLERDVPVALRLGDGEHAVTVLAGGRELDVGAEARNVVEAVAALSDRVVLTIEEDGPGELLPATRIGDGLVYHGVPWGFELTALVGAIVECGRLQPTLSAASRAALATLERDVSLEVFVTPT